MPTERVQRQIDRLLDEAEQAIAVSDWAQVQARCAQVEALDPGNSDAIAYREAAARALGAPLPVSTTPPVPRLPPSFVNGRFTVLGLLGEGGRKVVYRAHDTRLNRDVAFALIKTAGLDASERERVQREARTLGQLSSHPNIVVIYEIGDEDSRPYIVSELLPGGDLDDLLRATPEHRLPLEQVLTIGKAIGEALAFAHEQGVVHRDLKPGNVWLTAGGVAKLGDFGLAVSGERSRLTQVGMVVGTVAYMPPEQALGGETTPQADLYALGCVLYELITGRPPFLADDPTAVITQQLNTAPVAPSWLTDRCPPELERLVLQLLAKRPEQRPASARVVVEALARIDPAQHSASHSDSGSTPLDRLARGVFVGRENELARLRGACDRAFSSSGGLVMLVGEPGIGKTRTTRELETYARLRGAQVLWGQSHEESGAPAYWPWIQIGRQWGAGNDTVRLMSQLGSAVADLQRLFPELAQLPGAPPAATRDPEAAQFALFDAFVQLLRVASAQSPLLIVLDDLHWADKPTLQLLQHLAGEVERMRVLVVGTYRDTDLSRTHPLSQALAALNRSSGFTRIVLRGLNKDEVATYVETAAGVHASPALLKRLYEETEGNPFFLSEVVNLLTEEGTLTAEKASDIRVPDGVKEALGRRLDRLIEETAALLQVAAIIGREFTYDTLTLLGDQTEDELLKHIEAAVAARVIEELPQPGRYRFTHALMQETLLGELSTTRKVRLHGQVGEALEKRYGAQAEARAPRLAQHFGEAATLSVRHAGKAVRYAKLAAQQAEAATAWADAARYYEQVLTLLSSRETAGEEDEAALYLALGRCYRYTYEPRAAWRNLMRASGRYRERGDGQGLARVTLEAMQVFAPPDRKLTLVEEALHALGEEEPYLQALLLTERAMLEVRTAGAEHAALQAASLAGAHGYSDVSAKLTFLEALRAGSSGRFDEVAAKLAGLHEQLAAAGESMRAAQALQMDGAALILAGRLEPAQALTERALSYSRSIHSHLTEQMIVENLAYMALARRDEERVTTLISSLDAETLGGLLLRSLRLELADDLVGAVAQLPSPALAGNVLWPLLIAHGHGARVRLNAGDTEGARKELAAWLQTLNTCLRGPIDAITASLLPSCVPIADQALVVLGDDETVQVVYEKLLTWSELRFGGALAQGADHLRGDLAMRLGLVTEAEEHYRTGLAWGEREGVPVERGRCLKGLAEIAAQRGDTAAALQQLEQAVAIFEEADAPLYLRQAKTAQAGLDAGVPGADETSEPSVPPAEEAPSGSPVFISYASIDREQATGLAAQLEAAAYAVWLDQRSIAGASSWDEAIVRGIRGCRALVLLCSRAAVVSPNVQQELRLAMQYRKPILPLLLEETTYPEAVEYILAGRQWVEVLQRGEDEWLPQVLRALSLLGNEPAP